MIRPADIADLIRITDIYNQAIKSKKATGDMSSFKPEQRFDWLSEHCEQKLTPIFVYLEKGVVVGYCYLDTYRKGRHAFENVAEISYYIDFSYHRMGIGSKLIQFTIEKAKEIGYRNLLAILLSCNEGSIALLKKYNFSLWGVMPNIAYIDGNVYSHLYYGLSIEH